MFAAGKTKGVSNAVTYIEDVFSTYLYTGNGSTQTITNNIDLSTKGGLVWLKRRNGVASHQWYDTDRGATKSLSSNGTAGNNTVAQGLTAFGTTGFTLGSDAVANTSGGTYSSWAFRKQPKFFDVVTYTGTGTEATVAHSLGSVPGFYVVKRTNSTGSWLAYHRSLTTAEMIVLNSTAAASGNNMRGAAPTSTYITPAGDTDIAGATYVAYLFAHDAGGFGLTGTDNVISCGSFSTTSGSTTTVNLGYEPQWILVKYSNAVGDWWLYDSTRGWVAPTGAGTNKELLANTTGTEGSASSSSINVTSSGFVADGTYFGTKNLIYITIRRGPMKVPTDATKLYYGEWTQDVNTSVITDFPVDLAIDRWQYTNDAQTPLTGSFYTYDRLRGVPAILVTNTTAAETSSQPAFYVATTGFQSNTALGIGPGDGSLSNYYANFWCFKRAPSFLDVVCYAGTGSARTVTHNLGVAPELMIVKRRDAIETWAVYSQSLGATKYLYLNTTATAMTSSTRWNDTSPTGSVFTVSTSSEVNNSAGTYVAYLFATCPGVSKVGSYTGTGATQTINCGFTGGARWVMIKRTDTTGNWCQWDTARGMVASNDKKLLVNTTTAASNANWVYTATTGFQIVTSDADVNASGGTYIYLAIA